MSRLIREPLLHFFLLGAGLFAMFAWVDPDGSAAPDAIVVDDARITALEAQFQRVWQRPPTAAERLALVDTWVREEVLYREGLAMGLGRDDEVIRRRIAQKVAFISEDLLAAEPAETELEAWFAERREQYRREPRYTFEQVFLDPARRGGDLAAAVAAVRAALDRGASPSGLGDTTLLPRAQGPADHGEVARTFGAVFADGLAQIPVGPWHGPVESSFGVHLVRLETVVPGRLPELAEVRAAVERDYLYEQTRRANERFYEALRQRYDVVFETDRLGAADLTARTGEP